MSSRSRLLILKLNSALEASEKKQYSKAEWLYEKICKEYTKEEVEDAVKNIGVKPKRFIKKKGGEE